MSRDVVVNSMTCADNYNLLGLEGATEELLFIILGPDYCLLCPSVWHTFQSYSNSNNNLLNA